MAAAKTFDFIIIGAGSAGCVLANRLSADPANKVLLLEAGGRDLNPLFRLPMLMGKLFHSGIYNWHYHTEPEPHLNGRSLYWPRGKVLGGTSTINGMIYVRGNRHDYDRWAQMGATGWSYDEVLPAFLHSESHVQRSGAYHNAKGELTVCRARGWNKLLDVFHEAGGQAGYPHNDDFNGEEQEGFGRYDFTIAKGKRCSAAYAFLRPAKKRPNLTIITRAHTRRILIENGQAVGVEFGRKGNVSKAYADRQVILSAGVVNSPQILMLSGIGAADELTQHDIPVVQDLPGVGKNLQDHVDCVMAYECPEPVTLYSDLRADKLTWSVIQGMLFGEGIATTFPYEAGAFVKSRTDLAAPDIQLHFMPALEKTANLHFPNPFKKERVEANHGFSLRVGPVNPESRGEIRLRSADPMDRPRINANYLQTEFDIRTMVNAIRMTREIIKQKAFEKYRGKELAPGPAVESDAEMVKWLRTNAMTTFHPVGTCKMGSDPMAVVDARLKVHGIEGLRVADASIMPIISSGNTNAPAIMIGERAAEFILDEASR
ncbi:GMC family oxidoreductase [Mesorhizobium cantuariense]|uniref:GMC family oxidoreductase n=1 Tax=Mesorhizobium cantuariense TaxID=1300275 RepID=A0ABV7MJ87_9HYPH